MPTTLPTAYNVDIKKFYRWGCPDKRDLLMEQLKETMHSVGKSFARSFPNRTKRKDVVSHVLLQLSNSGVYAIESETLAKNVGCSVRTVSDAVKNIKETGEIIVTGLADGSNKYVFVLKSHENFNRILKEVFFIDVAEPIAEDIAEPECATNIEVTGLNDEKMESQSFKSLRSLSSTHESNIYIAESIENDFEEATKNPEKEAEYISTYYVSNFQKEVYDYIKSENSGFHDSIKESASILGLRVGSNSNHKDAVKAIQTVIKIDSFIADGGVVREGVPALFTKMYKHGLKMWEYERQYKQQNPSQAKPERIVKKVPFYNWLVNRD